MPWVVGLKDMWWFSFAGYWFGITRRQCCVFELFIDVQVRLCSLPRMFLSVFGAPLQTILLPELHQYVFEDWHHRNLQILALCRRLEASWYPRSSFWTAFTAACLLGSSHRNNCSCSNVPHRRHAFQHTSDGRVAQCVQDSFWVDAKRCQGAHQAWAWSHSRVIQRRVDRASSHNWKAESAVGGAGNPKAQTWQPVSLAVCYPRHWTA